MSTRSIAPALQVSGWLNAPANFTLQQLRGRVVVLEAFQMLCPGCVSHGLPQAQRIIESFDAKDVAVIGLHTVFEHHAAQGTRVALEAFAHEYRLKFPIGMDQHDSHGVPQTMNAYRMQGTPTFVLIDREGRLRMQHFGRLDDLRVGAAIAATLAETSTTTSVPQVEAAGCTADGCALT
jgi:peroxiredoxin